MFGQTTRDLYCWDFILSVNIFGNDLRSIQLYQTTCTSLLIKNYKFSSVCCLSSSHPCQVIRLLRPYRCECTLCCCCRQQMEVQSPPGVTIGWIKQNLSFLSPDFSVTDESGELMYRVKGPCLTCKWCDVEFHVSGVVIEHN